GDGPLCALRPTPVGRMINFRLGQLCPSFSFWRLVMVLSWIRRILAKRSRPLSRSGRKRPPQGRFVPRVEPLGDRLLPSVTASFASATGVLTVLGDNQANNIVVSRDAAGHILVNGGAVAVRGGAPTVANTSLIQVFGQAGNDHISLDETNGVLPSANL